MVTQNKMFEDIHLIVSRKSLHSVNEKLDAMFYTHKHTHTHTHYIYKDKTRYEVG